MTLTRNKNIKIATPVSDLFRNEIQAQAIISCSDCLESRDHATNAKYPNQILHHSDIELIHELSEKDLTHLERIMDIKHDLMLISFHAASACQNPLLVDGVYQPAGTQYTAEDMLEIAKKNITTIKTITGNNMRIAVENTNYYPTPAYNHVTDADFLSKLVNDNDLAFTFDIAHAGITAHNRDINFDNYIAQLPMDKVRQLHLSHFSINSNQLAADSHEPLEYSDFISLRRLMEKYRTIEFISLEYYKDYQLLIENLRTIREIINELS